jgi:hypothetical protein
MRTPFDFAQDDRSVLSRMAALRLKPDFRAGQDLSDWAVVRFKKSRFLCAARLGMTRGLMGRWVQIPSTSHRMTENVTASQCGSGSRRGNFLGGRHYTNGPRRCEAKSLRQRLPRCLGRVCRVHAKRLMRSALSVIPLTRLALAIFGPVTAIHFTKGLLRLGRKADDKR